MVLASLDYPWVTPGCQPHPTLRWASLFINAFPGICRNAAKSSAWHIVRLSESVISTLKFEHSSELVIRKQ